MAGRPGECLPPATGHRLLPHTADVMIEVWGATWEDCLAEATRALTACFVDTSAVGATTTVPVAFAAAGEEDLLVRVLDEAIFLLDAQGVVVVDAQLERSGDGGLRGSFRTAPADAVTPTGSVPKGVALHGLSVRRRADGWRCRFTVDV